MRFDPSTGQFDLSDLTDAHLLNEKLDDVLNVAVSVLEDYGDHPGNTRLEVMAHWLIANLAVMEASWPEVFVCGEPGEEYIDIAGYELNTEQARSTAAAILRCVERIESA